MNRRDFMRLLGLGATATAAGVLLPEVETVRRFWAVPRNAPVGPRRDWHGRLGLEEATGPITAFQPYSVWSFNAAEHIHPNALVAVREDGKVVNANGDPGQVAIGIARRTETSWSMETGISVMTDVIMPRHSPANHGAPAWLGPVPLDWLGPKRV